MNPGFQGFARTQYSTSSTECFDRPCDGAALIGLLSWLYRVDKNTSKSGVVLVFLSVFGGCNPFRTICTQCSSAQNLPSLTCPGCRPFL